MDTFRVALRTLLTRAALADAIDSVGRSGPLSPRLLLGTPARSNQPAAGALRGAALTLCDPRFRITLRIWSDETACAETTILFPRDPAAGGGYVLNDLAGGVEICGPIEAEAMLALVAPVLPGAPPGPPFVLQLDTVAMAVLAAAVDALRDDVRRRRVARALDGASLPDAVLADAAPLAPQRLAAHLDAWWGLSRFDHLLTYVVALGGLPRPPLQSEIVGAFVRLRDVGLIAIDGGLHIVPVVRLEPLVSAALGFSAGFQWQRAALNDDGGLAIDEHIVLPGAGGALFELSVTAAGLVRLARTDRASVAARLVAELAGIVGDRPPASATARGTGTMGARRRFCHQCGLMAAPTDRFCGSCGTKLL